jgi:hypothetical protein
MSCCSECNFGADPSRSHILAKVTEASDALFSSLLSRPGRSLTHEGFTGLE